MSNSIDQRIVEMKFDNAQFEKGIEETIKSLDSLDESLGLIDSSPVSEGISGLASSASELDGVASIINSGRSKISEAFDMLSSTVGKFTLISAGITAGITAITAAFNFQGGWNRAINLDNAKFQLTSLGYAWDDVKDSINEAVSGTAYSLDAAANACAQFSASGIKAGDDMTVALGAISGAAAVTNSSYEDMANIFTRAAGKGKIMGDELYSLSQRSMNAAAIMAEAWGYTEDEIHDMASRGEIAFSDFTQLIYDKYFEAAKDANSTFTGALSNMNAAWARFWAQFLNPSEEGGGGILNMLKRVFNSIRTTVNELTNIFSGLAEQIAPVTDAIGTFAENIADTLHHLWNDSTGEDDGNITLAKEAIWIFKNLGEAAASYTRPVVAFFDALFPSFEELFNWMVSIRDVNLTNRLKLTEGAVRILESAFSALGSVIKTVVGSVILAATWVLDQLTVAFIIVKDALDTFFDAIWDFAERGASAFSEALGDIKNPLDSLAEAFSNSGLMSSELGKHLQETGKLFGELWDIIAGDDGAASDSYRMPWDKIGAKIGEITEHLFGFLNITGRTELSDNLKNNFYIPFVNTMQGIWELITGEGGAELVFSELGSVFSSIANGFAEFAGIIGSVLADVAGVVLDGLSYVVEIISGIGSGIIDFFSTVISNVGVLGTSFVDGLVEGLGGDNLDSAASAFEDGMNTIADSASTVGDTLASSPIGELVSGIGEAFGEFGEAAKDHAPTINDWKNLFDGVNSSVGKFMSWLNPIERMKAAIEGLKEAFRDFGTDAFEGWGTKFLGDNSGIANLLDTLSTSLSDLWQTILENLPTGDQVAAAIGSLADGLVWLINTLAPLFEGLGRIIGSIGSDAIEFFSNLGESLSGFGGMDFSGVGDFFTNLFESFNQFSKDFASGDVNIFETISGFFENIFNFLTSLGDAIFGTNSADTLNTGTEILTGISDFCSGMTDQLGPVDSAAAIAQDVSGKLEQIGSDIENGTGFLGKALEWAQNNIVTIVATIAGGAMFVAVFQAVRSFKKVSTSLSGLFDGLSELSEALKNKINPPKQGILAQIRNFIIALVALAAAFVVISLIPKDNMIEALVVIGVLAVVIVGLIAAVAIINKKLGSVNIAEAYGMAAIVASIGAAVLLMSLSLALIALIPSDRALIAAAIVAGMMVGIYLICKVISSSINVKVGTQLLAASAGIMLLGVALLEFATIIAIFAIIPWGALLPGIIAVATELAALTAFGYLLGKNAGKMYQAASAIIIMGAAIAILTASLIALEIARTDATDYVQDAIVLIALVASLVAAIAVLDNIRDTAGTLQRLATVMQLMGVVLLEIAASLAIVETFGWSGNILSAMTSLTVVLAAMVAALLVLDKFSSISESAATLYLIAGALVVVAAAMVLVSNAISEILSTQSTWDQILSAALSMSLAFAAMTAALAILSSISSVNYAGIIVASGALLVLSGAMWVLADGLNSMSNVSWDNVWQLITVLAALTIAGAIAGFLLPVSVGMIAISAAALLLGSAILIAGTGVETFALGIATLSQTMVPFVEALDEAMGKFAETMASRFPELLDVFITNIQEFAARVPELIGSIASVVTSVIVGIAQGLANSVPQVADALLDMMESAINWMSQNGDRLQDDIIGFADVLGTMLGDAILGLITFLTSALGTLLEGLADMVVEATSNVEAASAKQRADSYVEAYAAELEKQGTAKVAEALQAIDESTVSSEFLAQSQLAATMGSAYYDTKNLEEWIAKIEYVLEDQALMNSLSQEQRDHIIELADATGNYAVSQMADLYRTTQEVNGELTDLQITQDGFVKDSKGIELPYQLLADNIQPIIDQYLPDMGISVDDIISGMETLGNGGLLEGLGASMTDISSLFDVLYEKGIINEEQLASLNEIDLSSLEGSLGGVFDGLGEVKFQTEEVGKTAEISGEAFATALASGIDVSGMVASLGEAKSALDETYTAFNKVHVGGSAAINALATIVSVQAARIKSDFNGIGNSARSLGSSISSALSGSGASSTAYAVGMNISIGLANGISAYKWIATQAAYSLGASAASSVKRGAQESSPSKITIEAGKFMAMGLGIGISQNERFALEPAEELGYSAAKAMRLSLGGVSDLLEGINWDANPVIRPVLDTSGIESGMMLINSMFGVSPTMQAAYANPGGNRIFTGGSPRIYHISVDLNYQAGDDAVALANGLVSTLENYANLEG